MPSPRQVFSQGLARHSAQSACSPCATLSGHADFAQVTHARRERLTASRFVGDPVAIFVDRVFSRRGRHLHRRYDFILARSKIGTFFVARFHATAAGSDVYRSRGSGVALPRHARVALTKGRAAETSASSGASLSTSATEASAASFAADSTVRAACPVRGLATTAVLAAQHEQAHQQATDSKHPPHGASIVQHA